ncbi:PREDICTED: uncharacterized protein LOC105571130 [Vollenhovia emeryi]|uniref:uncharacterized protein LOC105571130 n=1 Tax=Vollenhovia emeryi TaxID=411798 RepID=UPI0005F464F2|nr:PREDICTED: uncharacterized protein LOC105571130 [Vollenhovia emeryi]
MSEQFIKQTELLRVLSRSADNFKKVGRNNYTAAKVRSRIASVKETWNHCLHGHAVLLSLVPQKDRAQFEYFQEDQLKNHEEIYQATLDLMNEWLEEIEPPVSPHHSTALNQSIPRNETSALSLQHLPPIKLPPFTGGFHEWESFRDRFTALIIENKDLSNCTRMHFLASSLAGSALDTISSLAITADNFTVAWSALKARFENKRKLIDVHVAALYNLPAMSRESAVELHALRDRASKSVAALKSLGRSDAELLSDILNYFVTLKLDASTRRAWKLKCCSDDNPPNYEALKEFISSRALALEELDPAPLKAHRQVRSNNATATENYKRCVLCKESHALYQCDQFLKKNQSQRREYIKRLNRCFNCLGTKHSASDCPSKFSCRVCQKRHHSLLHIDSGSPINSASHVSSVSQAVNEESTPETGSEAPSSVVAMSAVSASAVPSPVLLATARVILKSPTGRELVVRALLDQGSEVTFVTHKITQILRLPRRRTFTTISAIGGSSVGTCRYATDIKFHSRDRLSPTFSTVAFIMPSLTKYNPPRLTGLSTWAHLQNLQHADDNPTGSEPIELIIGADLYGCVILSGVRKGSTNQPIAQNSHLGWIISGPMPAQTAPAQHIRAFHCALEDALKKFWEIEEIPPRRILSPDDQRAEDHFQATHSRAPDGRYIVRLPFKTGPPIEIGESRAIAVRKLAALQRRLSINSELKLEYAEFLHEYEQLKHMQAVSSPTSADGQIAYIPHHAVIRETSATTRVRVVFNASSLTTNNTSLNSH